MCVCVCVCVCVLYVYIYVLCMYIYIYCHPQTDCFVLSQYISVATPTRWFRPRLKLDSRKVCRISHLITIVILIVSE